MSSISIKATVPTIPKRIVPIYKVRTPGVDESTLFSLASRFKLEAKIRERALFAARVMVVYLR
jgi:hypothetical protein